MNNTPSSIEERVNFYLAPNLRKGEKVRQKLNDLNFGNIYVNNKFCTKKNVVGNKQRYVDLLNSSLIKYGLEDQKIFIMFGDTRDADSAYALSKCRRVTEGSSSYSLVKCMNSPRHWGRTFYKMEDLREFKDKANIAIWRGISSGGEWDGDLRTANRFALIEKHFNKHKNIDVGFVALAQIAAPIKNGGYSDTYRAYLKPRMVAGQMYDYKYILSVEGNDKDSGLNWKLNANSVVLMAKPQIGSWLMEETLIPNYHYIQLRDDFEDLPEKIKWCDDNADACIEIIKNAHDFTSQFKNLPRESEIEALVIKKHLELVEYYE